jgi:hypothetical protein
MAYAYRRGPAGGWNRQTQVGPDTNAPMFYSVAMSNGLAIMGAPTAFGAIVIPNTEGSVYVYRLQAVAGQFDQWVRQTRLHLPIGFEDEESFGLTLDAWGNRIAVGSRRESDFRGAVYVFARGTDNRWQQTARLVPKDTRRHCFSEAVSINFDRIAVPHRASAMASRKARCARCMCSSATSARKHGGCVIGSSPAKAPFRSERRSPIAACSWAFQGAAPRRRPPVWHT